MKRLTPIERIVAIGVLASAFVAVTLAIPGTARADYCNWTLSCSNGTCTIVSYFCSPFSGDCDIACDNEFSECVQECEGESGTHCETACLPVYTGCIGSCIPWL